MIEKIIEKVLDAMTPCLDQEQMEKLNNVLYLNFHDIEVKQECYELKPTGLSGRKNQPLFYRGQIALKQGYRIP